MVHINFKTYYEKKKLAGVARVKHWPTDLAAQVRAPLKAKSSQP